MIAVCGCGGLSLRLTLVLLLCCSATVADGEAVSVEWTVASYSLCMELLCVAHELCHDASQSMSHCV